jgi:hypothetical protein
MRRGTLVGTLSLLRCSTDSSSMSLRSGFRNRFILDPLFKSTDNFCRVFPNRLDRRIYYTKFPTHISFFFLLSISRMTNFRSALRIFLLLVSVAMLSLYHFPVQWRNRKVEGNLTHKVNYHYCCHFPGQEIIWLPEREDLPSQDDEMSGFSEYSTSWNITVKTTIGNVISEVVALVYSY